MPGKETGVFKVPDLACVDREMLARIKWPPALKTMRFLPRAQKPKLYETLLRNIPEKYKVRLAYYAGKKDLLLPAAMPGASGLKVKPFQTKKELLREYKRSFFLDYLKPFYPRNSWKSEFSASLPYLKIQSTESGARPLAPHGKRWKMRIMRGLLASLSRLTESIPGILQS